MKHVTILLFMVLSFSIARAQRLCNTPVNTSLAPLGFSPNSFAGGVARDTTANEIITIPVVVHILYKTSTENISREQVLSQLKILNDDYRRRNADTLNTPAAFKSRAADARITFCLAQVDPQGRPSSGIIRKSTSEDYFQMNEKMKYSATGGDNAWDATKYLNIWVCNLGNRNLGYASLPGGSADKDGVVINQSAFGNMGTARAPFDKGRTATHEVAHWLGLKHIWGDNRCASDDVDDTPPQEGYNFYCPTFPHMSSCSPDVNGDMFMNFMDFTDDACMNMFTQGQKAKMRGLFAINMPRNSFLVSYACDSAMATGGPVVVPVPVATAEISASVYPNPVTSSIQLHLTDVKDFAGLQAALYDGLGRLVWKKNITAEKSLFPAGILPAGIYNLRITGENFNRNIRILTTGN